MNCKHEFVLREVAGDYLLIPTGTTALDLNGMLTLNEVGAAIWNMLPEVENEVALAQRLAQEYDAPPEQIRADVAEFLGRLRELDIL